MKTGYQDDNEMNIMYFMSKENTNYVNTLIFTCICSFPSIDLGMPLPVPLYDPSSGYQKVCSSLVAPS